MTTHSPATLPGVREEIAPESFPGGDIATRQELVPVPAFPVRRMIAMAAASTAAFVVLSLTPYVGEMVRTVQNSTGLPLLLNELFWLSAAAMGASFALLLQASVSRVRENDDRSYGLQLFVSAMAGFILVSFVPISVLLGSRGLSQPALAMLGAFFASMVFRFLPGGRAPREDGGDNATQEP
jgi:hypothetical protein